VRGKNVPTNFGRLLITPPQQKTTGQALTTNKPADPVQSAPTNLI